MHSVTKNTHQYGCKCGKEFSGEPTKIRTLLKLHYKICKYPRNSESNSIIIRHSNDSQDAKIITGLPVEVSLTEATLLKSFIKSN